MWKFAFPLHCSKFASPEISYKESAATVIPVDAREDNELFSLMGRHKCEAVACLSSQVKCNFYQLLCCALYLWRIKLIWFEFDLIYLVRKQKATFQQTVVDGTVDTETQKDIDPSPSSTIG